MYAIIESGGKQYKVKEGDILKLEKLPYSPGDTLEVSHVLLVKSERGVEIGSPIVPGAKVLLTVLEHGKGDKIVVFKYKPKKNYRRKYGHRQQFTKVRVEKIMA
ncbi:MAG: 50S ribosomal protein L21 [Clostridia bacterium]|nr:50S ribosomal protein L21 [Clostridia bacterium]